MREGPNGNEGAAASGFLAGDRGLRRHGARPWKQHKNPKPIARIAVEHRPKLSYGQKNSRPIGWLFFLAIAMRRGTL
jgi:hypothetical protein